MRCWVHWQKLTEQVFQYLGISRRFDEPNPCISSFWEKHENHKWWHLLFVTSNTLQEASSSTSLQICMLDCMYPLHQNHLCTDLPHLSLGSGPSELWDVVFCCIVLILPQIKQLTMLTLCEAFFLVFKGLQRRYWCACVWGLSSYHFCLFMFPQNINCM